MATFTPAKRRVLLAVLAVDGIAVTGLAVAAIVVAATGVGALAPVRALVFAECAVVGYASWAIAIAAVSAMLRHGNRVVARRCVWAGLVVNTVGCIVVVGVTTFPSGPELIVAGLVAVAGGVLAFAYLSVLGSALRVSRG